MGWWKTTYGNTTGDEPADFVGSVMGEVLESFKKRFPDLEPEAFYETLAFVTYCQPDEDEPPIGGMTYHRYDGRGIESTGGLTL